MGEENPPKGEAKGGVVKWRASSHPWGEKQAEGSFMYLVGSEVGKLEEFGCAPSLKCCRLKRRRADKAKSLIVCFGHWSRNCPSEFSAADGETS